MNRKLIYITLVMGLASVQCAAAEESLGTGPEEYDYTDYAGPRLTWVKQDSIRNQRRAARAVNHTENSTQISRAKNSQPKDARKENYR